MARQAQDPPIPYGTCEGCIKFTKPAIVEGTNPIITECTQPLEEDGDRTLNGEEVCEGHDYNEDECNAKGYSRNSS